MTDKLEVRATARREGDMWVIDIAEWGVTQAHRLSEVEFMARDYAACLADVDRADVDVFVSLELPQEVNEAKPAREAAVEAEADAAARSREVVRSLQRQGWLNGEIAKVLGATPARVTQLAGRRGEANGGGKRSRAGRVLTS